MTDTRPSQPRLIPPPPVQAHTHIHTPPLHITHTLPVSLYLVLCRFVCQFFHPFFFPRVPSLIILLPTCPLPFIFFFPSSCLPCFSEVPPIRNALSFLTPSASFHSLSGNFYSPHSLSRLCQRTVFECLIFLSSLAVLTPLFIVSSVSKDKVSHFLTFFHNPYLLRPSLFSLSYCLVLFGLLERNLANMKNIQRADRKYIQRERDRQGNNV